MKRSNKNYILFVFFGILLMSFIFQHYANIPDIVDEILKGTSIGLLLLGVIFLSKEKIEQV
jgi:polyferredoxin